MNPVQRKMYKEDDIDIWDDNLKMEDSDGQVGQGLYFYCHVNKKYVLQTLIFRPSLVKVRGRVKLRKFDSNSNSCSNSLLHIRSISGQEWNLQHIRRATNRHSKLKFSL